MTRIEKFRQELKSLYDWDENERAKIAEHLKANGEHQTGLDANQEAYRGIISEFNKRFEALIKTYSDLPKNTKIKISDATDEQRQSD